MLNFRFSGYAKQSLGSPLRVLNQKPQFECKTERGSLLEEENKVNDKTDVSVGSNDRETPIEGYHNKIIAYEEERDRNQNKQHEYEVLSK